MKLLSITDSKGYFLGESGQQEPLDQIDKEDLLRLVELILTTDAEMDEFDPAQLQNQAHQIIYENLWSKLTDLAGRRTEFLDESKRLFLSEYERYRDAPRLGADSQDADQATTDSPAARD